MRWKLGWLVALSVALPQASFAACLNHVPGQIGFWPDKDGVTWHVMDGKTRKQIGDVVFSCKLKVDRSKPPPDIGMPVHDGRICEGAKAITPDKDLENCTIVKIIPKS